MGGGGGFFGEGGEVGEDFGFGVGVGELDCVCVGGVCGVV